MKLLIPLIIFAAVSTSAHAHPGGHTLVCKSAKNSGSHQEVEISLHRSNGIGWYAPVIEISIDNQKIALTTPDDASNYGTTFHNSPLKVIVINAEVPYERNANTGGFSIAAIPETVKSFDNQNQPVIWSLKDEKDECNDTNGKATFQGILHGFLRANDSDIDLDAQIMDCELSYNSGMAC